MAHFRFFGGAGNFEAPQHINACILGCVSVLVSLLLLYLAGTGSVADLGAGLIDEVVSRKQILFLARSEAGEEMPSGEEGGHVEGNLTIRGSRKRSAPPRPKEEEFRQRARKSGSQVSRSAEAKRSLVANEAKRKDIKARRTKVKSVAAMPSPPALEGSHDGASGAGPWGFPASGADAEPQSAQSVAE
jgi:hypothetical protein